MTRGSRLVLGLILGATIFSMAAIGMLYLAVAQEPQVAPRSTLLLRPSGDFPEVMPDVVFGSRGAFTMRSYLELIRKAKADPRIAGILLEPGGMESPYWAKVQELRDALRDFRQGGKFVHALLTEGGQQDYYLATAADRIYLAPSTTLGLTGIASYEVFLRGAFDLIGTYPEFVHIGDYKTAVNTYLEKSYTAAHKEMTDALNRDRYDQLVRGIADGRQKREEDVRALIDEGPFEPAEALRAGLIDDVAYDDELDDLNPDLAKAHLIEASEYAAVSWASAGVTRKEVIAVITASGVITGGRSGFDPVNGAVVGAESIIEHIREARANPSVRAIVLRVDSPGGSSTASDLIWRELFISRSPTRPIIVSMSDLAASGGYYIALAGDVIVAEPGTLTGSIGVYTGKFVTSGTLAKLGVNIEGASIGKRAEMDSPDRRFTPDERAKVVASMQAVYDQFVERAAESRRMAPEKIDLIAQGRVWTGEQAKARGLVDQLGGLDKAIDIAKQRAGIPAYEEVDVLAYPRRRSVYEFLSEELQPTSERLQTQGAAEALAGLLGPRERRAVAGILAPARLFRPGQILAHMPYVWVN